MFDWFKKKETCCIKEVCKETSDKIMEQRSNRWKDALEVAEKEFQEKYSKIMNEIDEKNKNFQCLIGEVVKLKVENSPEMIVIRHNKLQYNKEFIGTEIEFYTFDAKPWVFLRTFPETIVVNYFACNGILQTATYEDSSLLVKVKKTKGK